MSTRCLLTLEIYINKAPIYPTRHRAVRAVKRAAAHGFEGVEGRGAMSNFTRCPSASNAS